MTNYLKDIILEVDNYLLTYGKNYDTLKLKTILLLLDEIVFNKEFEDCLKKYNYINTFLFNFTKNISKDNMFYINDSNLINNKNIFSKIIKESFYTDCMKKIIADKIKPFDDEDYYNEWFLYFYI